jgi:hypothetical protein
VTEDSASGNRWEPVPANRPTDPGPSEGPQPQADAAAQPAPAPQPTEDAEDTQAFAEPAAPTGRRSLRREELLAGVAAALFLGGGAGGFALGHSAAGDSTAPTGSDPFGHHSGPPGFGPGDPDGDVHGPRGYGEAPGTGGGDGTDDGGSSANGTGA